MTRRQIIPEQWLIVAQPMAAETWRAVRRLPRGSGVLLLERLNAIEKRQLRHLARLRALRVVSEGRRTAARVHNVRELRRALSRRTPMILLSPLYPTRSHPGWKPLPRMRAAALARSANRNAIALGGMNAQRYARVAPLGFISWAGISAFRT